MKPSRIAVLLFGIVLAWTALFAARRELDRRMAPASARQRASSAPSPLLRALNPFAEITRVFMPGNGAPAPAAETASRTPRPATREAPPSPSAPEDDQGKKEARDSAKPVKPAAPPGNEEEEAEDRAASLTITTPSLPPAVTGAAYYVPLFAEGGTLPYTWRISSGTLPAGIELDGMHGMLRGTAASPVSAQITLAVSDSGGETAEAGYLLSVTDGGGIPYTQLQGKITQPLYITTGALPDASPGQSYSVKIEATGGTPPYAWTITSGQLPGALSLAAASGLIEGVPEAAGRAVFRIKATDTDLNSDIAEQTLTVRGQELLIVTEAFAEGTTGERYEQAVSATGGTPPYSWQVYPVSLPAGLAIDPSRGVISGTPESADDVLLTLGVSDTQGEKASAEFELVIRAASLAVTTSGLPQCLRDKPYEASIEAEGGVPPYRWSLSGGALPAGLALDAASGLISGTTSATAGDYGLQAAVTDGAAARATRDLTLSIAEESRLSITDLSAVPSDRKVALTWTNPAQADYAYTVLLRNTAAYPTGPEDGVAIYQGPLADFLDRELPNGTACYYAAIPYTTAGTAGAIVDGARAAAVPQAVTLSGPADPFADSVASFEPLSAGGYGSSSLSWVLGAPRGSGAAMGSPHVVSLHARANTDNGASAPYGGSITLEFKNNIVVNGPGTDFIVFENAFYVGGDPQRRWMEPAIVSVSKDGARFYTFLYDFVPHYTAAGEINPYNPYCYINADGSSRGFAGVSPVYSSGGVPDPRTAAAGGDAFDLDRITGVKLDWIRFVRITATGDNWLVDSNGDRVRHVTEMGSCSGAGTSGFDLDAVCAVNY
ncbi:MAG: putative Ig domain-containing protein [Chlamydiota bacterium]